VPDSIYRERLGRFTVEAETWAARSRAFSIARLVVFLLALGCGFMALLRAGSTPTGWLIAGGGFLAVFVVLVLLHDRVIREERRFRDLAALNREGLARLEHEWAALPLPGAIQWGAETLTPGGTAREGSDALPPVARDLHLFGHASLFHLVGPRLSPPGRNTLAAWLLEPASPEEIRRRQEAVRELAAHLDLRQELARQASHLTDADADLEPFLSWAEGEPWLLRRRGLIAASFVLPLLTLGGFVAWGLGTIPFAAALILPWVNIAFSAWRGGPMHEIFDRISARETPFQHYAAVLAVLDEEAPAERGGSGESRESLFESELLREKRAELTTSGLSAAQQMESLHQRVVLSDSRHSAPLNFILESLFLWTFHVLRRLERWQRECGGEARRWLTALGEIEALAALGRLSFDNPDWAFPEIVTGDQPVRVQARELAHPLLVPDTRVANDVEVGPAGTFMLVTGSNMSGKSTLLRSLGINVVLAQAGAPVCACTLRLPPLALGTSILIEDSLGDGISFFMAELLRLREIVESARRCRGEGRTLLYLLDEVLRGTNSRERRLAARHILRHLLAAGAVGAISTHDPALLESEELVAVSHTVYFEETVHTDAEGKNVMSFDYKLREGVNTGGNALKLLELVGLGGEEDLEVRTEPETTTDDLETTTWTT